MIGQLWSLPALYVFGGVFVLDFAWAKYTSATADKAVLRSSTYSVAVFAANAAITIGYVADPWMLIPGCGGAFLGTGLSVWLERRRERPVSFPAAELPVMLDKMRRTMAEGRKPI